MIALDSNKTGLLAGIYNSLASASVMIQAQTVVERRIRSRSYISFSIYVNV